MRAIESFYANHRNDQCFYQSCYAFENAILSDDSDKMPWRMIVVVTHRLSSMIWEREHIMDSVDRKSHHLALSIFKWLGYLSFIFIPWALKLAEIQRSFAEQQAKICDQHFKIAHIWDVAAHKSAEKIIHSLEGTDPLKSVFLSLVALRELKDYAFKIHHFKLLDECVVNRLYIPSKTKELSRTLKEKMLVNMNDPEGKKVLSLLLNEIEERVFSLVMD